MKKTIAVDFDGVIHKYSRGYQDGSIYDEPVEGALETMEKLSQQFNVVIFTVRPDIQATKNWLFNNGFLDYEVTHTKPKAIAYIDDRAIRFTNWKDIKNYFM